jgi:hypothetical protein
MRCHRSYLPLLFACLALPCPAAAQDASAVWQGLGQAAFDPAKSASVENLAIARDRIHITLESGTIQFTQAVAGVVYGAAFRGHGRIQIEPPNPLEVQQLQLFTGKRSLEMEFTEATLTFTDGTYDEVAKQVRWASAADAHLAELYERRQQEREDLGAAVLPRLFQGVLSGDRKRTALFVADLNTKEKGWMEVSFDALSPEEVRAGRWADLGPIKQFDTWMSFPAGGRSARDVFRDPLAKDDFLIRGYQISATVTGGAELSATTQVRWEPRAAGEHVLRFVLDSNLRVDSVKDAKGATLPFFQARERKERNQSYGDYVAVVLPQATQPGPSDSLTFQYAGRRVIRKVGSGNYFCESFGWYPAEEDSFATRADFEMVFRSPKKYTLVATGNRTDQTNDGDWTISTWKSGSVPLAVAGFAFGDYKVYSEKAGPVDVEVYANREPDDALQSLKQLTDNPLPNPRVTSPTGMVMGSLTPSGMAKTMSSEIANTLRIFQLYFGPYPYQRLAVTNIPYSYGQGWPMLLYLSTLSFLDSTQRHQLGIRDEYQLTDFFRAHETSHQWWGHRVSWKSYHDQWLSEGFAQFSGNLYTEFRENMKEYQNRVRRDKEDLLSADRHGHTYESLGPIWMGERLGSSESPRGYAVVIYDKGGYVLHMLRMMLYNNRSQDVDDHFKAMMQDFCKTFENKAASTEDFKAVAEKFMTPQMDLDGNHRLDWFFNQYVYGTGLAHYQFSYRVETTPDGKAKIIGKVARSGVPESWKDILPLYLHTSDGKTRQIGFIRVAQDEAAFDFTLPNTPEKLVLNEFNDILAEVKQ